MQRCCSASIAQQERGQEQKLESGVKMKEHGKHENQKAIPLDTRQRTVEV